MSHGGVSPTAAPTPGKEREKKTPKEFETRNQVDTVTHIYQGFEASASRGDGIVGGRGIQPQTYSIGPS